MIWSITSKNSRTSAYKLWPSSPKSSSETLYTIPEDDEATLTGQCNCHRRLATSNPSLWLFSLLAIITYTCVLLFYHQDRTCKRTPTLLPHEIRTCTGTRLWQHSDTFVASAEHAMEYQTQVFEPSSFGFTKPVNKYEGPPTPKSNAAWHELWNGDLS